MKEIILQKGKHERIRNGHPWVFDNEIGEGDAAPGEIVRVKDSTKKFIGMGYYNPHSKIRVRLLTRNANENIDEEFFSKRLQRCFDYRKQLVYTENFRLVFGESDFLPGLIIDKFGDVFVLQTLSYGMEVWKETIVRLLQKLFSAKKIYERNDIPVREREGLKQQKGFLSEPFNTSFIINECGVQFMIDVENGQKTGFFLDQKENRLALQNICTGAEVLDCFCYTGAFAMFAAKFGAKKVTGIDVSDQAVEQSQKNAALNNFSNLCEFKTANTFDLLPELIKEKKQFDVIILDPPAFTKSRSAVDTASKGYKEINLRAMKLLRPGGFLFTFSCSHFMTPSLFFETVSDAALDAGKTIRQVQYLAQAKDHPIVWGIDETSYLKGLILQVC